MVPVVNIKSLILALLFALSLGVSPAVGQGQPQGEPFTPITAPMAFGNSQQFWDAFCINPPSTNIFSVFNSIFDQIGNMQGLLGDLSEILNFDFNVPDFLSCLPDGFDPPSLSFPGVPNLAGCFNLPNLSGVFSGMSGCINGILGAFPDLSGILVNFDMSSIANCLMNQLPAPPQLTVPDILGNLLEIVGNIADLLNSIQGELPRLKEFLDWALHICETEWNGGGGGFAMSGAAYGTSAAQSGSTLNLTFNYNGATGANGLGSAGLGATAGAQSVSVAKVYSKLGGRTVSGKRINKTVKFRQAGDKYLARIKLAKLPAGVYRYNYFVTNSEGRTAVLPGGKIDTRKGCEQK